MTSLPHLPPPRQSRAAHAARRRLHHFSFPQRFLAAAWLVATCAAPSFAQDPFVGEGPSAPETASRERVIELLSDQCGSCHGNEDDNEGDFDLRDLLSGSPEDTYVRWRRVLQLINEGTMPPDEELGAEDSRLISEWYVHDILGNARGSSGYLPPRKLSAHEYRNALHSVLGFSLDTVIREAEQTVAETSLVMKLLPLDPPGPSGFTNDTSANPLTTLAWDQYAYLADTGLDQLFASQNTQHLYRFTGNLDPAQLTEAQAGEALVKFASKAWRRPVSDIMLRDSLERFSDLTGDRLVKSLRDEFKLVLMSPRFLYVGLKTEYDQEPQQWTVSGHGLAERLSFFLWADLPDEQLTAKANSLQKPEELQRQIERMLNSPKSRNLAEDFGVQWLSLNEIDDDVSNNPPVAHALRTQPIDFLDHLFRDDRPLIELIDSRTTFINAHTAKYYNRERQQLPKYRKQRGIEVEALDNQRVQLDDANPRGGILTMPGVLAMNRGPILRGTWMLERILGEELPEPPADVGQIPASPPGENLTFRQRFEQHRSQSSCAVCHDKIDPLGFALQEYGQQGQLLTQPNSNAKKPKKSSTYDEEPGRIDSSGQLPDGTTFEDFVGLKRILVTSKRRQVIENITRRLMAFALARELQLEDESAVMQIVHDMDADNGTFRDLIRAIVVSSSFRGRERTNIEASNIKLTETTDEPAN